MIQRRDVSILCVDDEPSVLRMLARVLSGVGYAVEMAENAFVALQKLNHNPSLFHFLVTDIRMPGMDGFTLIERARAAGYSAPILVYAGMLSEDDRQRLRELHVGHVISKPATAQLIAAIKEQTHGAGGSAQGA